jgi:hypothetical protein
LDLPLTQILKKHKLIQHLFELHHPLTERALTDVQAGLNEFPHGFNDFEKFGHIELVNFLRGYLRDMVLDLIHGGKFFLE